MQILNKDETVYKMRPEFKKLWLDALRSGKYEQGKSCLLNLSSGQYCCLGVQAAICGGVPEDMDGLGYFTYFDESLIDSMSPEDFLEHSPEFTQDLIDFYNATVIGCNTRNYTPLARFCTLMNDGGDITWYLSEDSIPVNIGSGMSFKEIADFLEKHI